MPKVYPKQIRRFLSQRFTDLFAGFPIAADGPGAVPKHRGRVVRGRSTPSERAASLGGRFLRPHPAPRQLPSRNSGRPHPLPNRNRPAWPALARPFASHNAGGKSVDHFCRKRALLLCGPGQVLLQSLLERFLRNAINCFHYHYLLLHALDIGAFSVSRFHNPRLPPPALLGPAA